MPSEFNENNIARISGIIDGAPELTHTMFGEGFYSFNVKIMRTSGSFDFIPVVLSNRLAAEKYLKDGNMIFVEGQFRSHNVPGKNHSQLKLMVFARKVVFFDENGTQIESVKAFSEEYGSFYDASEEDGKQENEITIVPDMNEIFLDGYICKPPVFRITPLKREIADLLLAVNRMYNKSDYIPCICWGRNARFCGKRTVGEHVKIRGRIQSRAYNKKLPDGTEETRVAYEVSMSGIEVENDGAMD